MVFIMCGIRVLMTTRCGELIVQHGIAETLRYCPMYRRYDADLCSSTSYAIGVRALGGTF